MLRDNAGLREVKCAFLQLTTLSTHFLCSNSHLYFKSTRIKTDIRSHFLVSIGRFQVKMLEKSLIIFA